MMKPLLVTHQLKFHALSIILCKTMKKTVSATVVGPRKREIGLVVPAKFSAYTADRRVAQLKQIFSQKRY